MKAADFVPFVFPLRILTLKTSHINIKTPDLREAALSFRERCIVLLSFVMQKSLKYYAYSFKVW